MLEGEAYGHSPERCAGNEEDPSLRGEAVAGTAHRHPCGANRFAVLRVGMDFRLRCLGCGREVMTPRFKAEKSIRAVFREGKRVDKQQG